ncbi:MAG: prolyl oligopeptidase family serine peptidase [Fimbriimonadaceae bacterium]
MKRILANGLLVALALAFALAAGQKKPLTHDVYDSWKTIAGVTLSNDGKWLAYTVSPQEGDNVVHVKATDGGKSYTFDRGTNVRISNDSRFVVATIVPKREDTLKATRDKVKPEDRPKNALMVLNLATGEKTELERVTSYTIAAKDSGWIVYRPEPPKPEPPKPAEKPAEGEPPKQEEPQKKKGHGDGSTIVLRNLASGEEVRMDNVGTSDTNEAGTVLYFVATPKGVEGHGVFAYEFSTKAKRPIMEGLAQYTRLALSEDGRRIAVLTDKDDYKAEKPSFAVYWSDTARPNARRAAYEGDKGIPQGWYVPPTATMRWNKSADRLIFTTVVKPPAETPPAVPDEEKVNLDVWSWTDVELQPQQLLRANAARNRTYDAIFTVSSGAIVQIETPEMDTVQLPRDGNGNWGLYSEAHFTGAGTTPDDVYLVDLRTGQATLLFDEYMGNLSFSPTGRWLMGYDYTTHASFMMDPQTKRRTDLNDRFKYPIYDTKDDHPFGAGPFGFAGWSQDDSVAYVYDEYDVWAIDLTKTDMAQCVTGEYGRNWDTRLRYDSVDPEAEYIDPSKPAYFTAFENKTKRAGFVVTTFGARAYPQNLGMAEVAYGGLTKARDADVFMFQRETVRDFRDVYVTNARLTDSKKFSDANPQTAEYVWPTVELVEWNSGDGERLQGLLYRPDDFDPAKKYPMIAYFYERSSDGLHRYQTPAPSASTVNVAYFVSNGYCVFMPDIPYKVGYPGESAVSAIVSGVNRVLDMGFVDPKRVGIQGQSWGGYQVTYLVTETNMFAAAGAGAPVSNMFSAYGGIRWGSGVVRQLQYEQGQSRIGGTPWEMPLRYLENSPVFFADKVKTPLLIMHNDADGAVPWWQGIEMFTALWRLDKPCWMLVYNGEDHNLVQRKNRKDLSVRLQQFFDHYLKGEPMPVWMAEGVPASKKGTTYGFEIPDKKSGGN